MAAGLLKGLAGKFSKDIFKNAAKEAALGSLMNAGFGLMSGSPRAALAYGLGDFVVNVPAIGLAKTLAPKQQWLANTANVVASLGAIPVQDALLGARQQVYSSAPLLNKDQLLDRRKTTTIAQNNLQNPQLAGQRVLSSLGNLIDSPSDVLRQLSPETLRGLGYAI
jgi:hypothetical protein